MPEPDAGTLHLKQTSVEAAGAKDQPLKHSASDTSILSAGTPKLPWWKDRCASANYTHIRQPNRDGIAPITCSALRSTFGVSARGLTLAWHLQPAAD